MVASIRVFASWYMGGESGLFYWILVYFLLLLGMYLSSTFLKRCLLEAKKEFMCTRGRRILWWCLWLYHTLLFLVAAVIAGDPFFNLHPYFWWCCFQLIVVNCPLYRGKSSRWPKSSGVIKALKSHLPLMCGVAALVAVCVGACLICVEPFHLLRIR